MKIMRTSSIIKRAQEFEEIQDSFNDDTVEQYNKYLSNEENKIPVAQIDEDEIEGTLVDNIDEEEVIPEEGDEFDEQFQEPFEEPEIEGVDVPEFATTSDAMQWAIDNSRVLKIFYITSGRSKGKGGIRLKREIGLGGGAQIHRIVEPHHLYQAMNGNLILVTYDRSVRAIRSFIVSNIVDYSFLDKEFKKRLKVLPRSGKGIRAMENIKTNLKKIADDLEGKKLSKSASVVKDAIQSLNEFKVAQYVGVQGYWIRNRRCWDNCYRQKRTTQPETPAQEVWMSCWDEYKKSINDDKSGWEKYASEKNTTIKDISVEKEWNEKFIEVVSQKIEKGASTPEAVYDTINENSKMYTDKIIQASSDLMVLAGALHENGDDELADKMIEASMDMLKEAGLWEGIKNVGKGVKDWWSRNYGQLKRVIDTLKDLHTVSNGALTMLNRGYQSAAASGDKVIIEAGKGSRVEKKAAPPFDQGAATGLPREFQAVYTKAVHAIRELSSLVSVQPQNSPTLTYLNAGVSNIQSFIDQADQAVASGQIETQMVPLLQNLSKVVVQAMTGINTSAQQMGGEQDLQAVDDPTTPIDESVSVQDNPTTPTNEAVPNNFGNQRTEVAPQTAPKAAPTEQNQYSLFDLAKMDRGSLKKLVKNLIDKGQITPEEVLTLGKVFDSFRKR